MPMASTILCCADTVVAPSNRNRLYFVQKMNWRACKRTVRYLQMVVAAELWVVMEPNQQDLIIDEAA